MKTGYLMTLCAAGLWLLTSNPAIAAEQKTVTIKGEGKCAKCALKEGDKCQNVIQTKEDGKQVTYYMVRNEVANKFHSNVCQGTKKVTAKGTVKEVDGKKELTATEVKVAE
jgi:RecG-like helicase